MKRSLRIFVGAAVAATIVGAAGVASAQATKAEAKCHATIGKAIGKYQAALAKNIVGCHKGRNAGKIGAGVDCNNAITSDVKGKRGTARSKASGLIGKLCTTPDSNAVLARYVACPSPVSGSDGPNGIDNFTEVATCLLDLSEAYMEKIGDELLGNPVVAPPLSKEEQLCHSAVGKAFAKAAKTVAGSRGKCQAGVEKAGGSLDFGGACATTDPDGKITPALSAISSAITASCSASVLPNRAAYQKMGFCAQRNANPTPALQVACGVTKVAAPILNGLAGAAQELQGLCPSVADVIINAQNGNKPSNTRLDSGWTGLAQDVDVVDNSFGAVSLSNCDDDCTNCEVTHNPKNGNCRCSNDSSIVCTEMNAQSNCGMGNTCFCMFGPPLPIAAGGTPVCVVNRFAQEFDGLTGEIGEYSVGTRTRALVHTGISPETPCPTCVGGQCQGGSRNGLGCAVSATSPDFGPVSFDCLPSLAANISGAGLNLGLVFTSGTSSITASIPTGAACAAGNCHCSQCTGDASVGCASDTDCDDAAVAAGGSPGDKGTCGSVVAPSPRQNGCDGGIGNCVDQGDGTGKCSAGPFDVFCDGVLRDNGTRGVISCGSDTDCDAADCDADGIDTPGECGTCTVVNTDGRDCFLPTVAASGTPGIFNSEGVSTFCSAQTSSPSVNISGGLPGPGRVKLDFDFNLFCSNGTTQFQLPAGSNCP